MEKSDRRFWAIEVEPGKLYTQTPPAALHLSQAALGSKASTKGRNSLECVIDNHTFTLCTLSIGQNEQFPMDILLDENVPFSFKVVGKESIFVTGYFLLDNDMYDYIDDQNEGEEEIIDGEESSKEEIEEEESKEETKRIEPKKETPSQSQNSSEKKRKVAPEEITTPSKTLKKSENSTPSKQSQQTSPKAKPEPPKDDDPKIGSKNTKSSTYTLPGGLIVEDLLIGSGGKPNAGKEVEVKYIGRDAKTGVIFDSSKKGTFKFRFATGSVIKGWDIGLKNMKEGGRRRITIPPALAYGQRGAPPDIRPNATLIFEIELVKAK